MPENNIDTNPLVSVIVPCYNHANYLEECILSIVNQTYKNIELIVIDDGSTDNSREVLEALQQQYHFILEFQENMGIAKTLNKAREKYVTGKYISGSGSDDYMAPNKIEVLVNFLEKNPEYGMAFGKVYMIDSKGNIMSDLQIIDPVIDPIESLKFESLIQNDCIPSSAIMIRADIMEECGGYNENTIVEDLDLILKVAYISKIAYIEEYLAYYRWHGDNMTTRTLPMCKAVWDVVYSWKDKMNPSFAKKVLARRSSINFSILARNHKKESFRFLKKNFSYLDGFMMKNYIKGFVKLLFCWKNNNEWK